MKTIKRMMMVMLMSLTLLSCEKEQTQTEQRNCNCGLITEDGIEILDSQFYYWVDIRNSCSGNIQRFYLTEGDWMNAFVGSNLCLTNVSNWKVGFDSDYTIDELNEIKSN